MLDLLQRLAEGGYRAVSFDRWRDLANWCWDYAEASGDARYCSLARGPGTVASAWSAPFDFRLEAPEPVGAESRGEASSVVGAASSRSSASRSAVYLPVNSASVIAGSSAGGGRSDAGARGSASPCRGRRWSSNLGATSPRRCRWAHSDMEPRQRSGQVGVVGSSVRRKWVIIGPYSAARVSRNR